MTLILRKPILTKPLPDRGMGLLEPLVLTAMLLIAVTAMASVFDSISRMMVSTRQRVIMQAEIDSNLKVIKSLARQFTCCSGYCTTSPPNCGNSDLCPDPKPPDTYNYGTVKSVLQPCATNNPMDDRYYFPQVDLESTTDPIDGTGTSSEPLAVEQLCKEDRNNHFMEPLKKKVDDDVLIPTDGSRETDIKPHHVLQVTFKDSHANIIRMEKIIPKMAYFCP